MAARTPRKKTPPLRAVAAGEKVAVPAHASAAKTVAQAAKSKDAREVLVATRDRIAKAIDDPKCPFRELGVLTKRLEDIREKIESIDARNADGDPSTELREHVSALTTALRDLDPDHPLLGDDDDSFDAAAI